MKRSPMPPRTTPLRRTEFRRRPSSRTRIPAKVAAQVRTRSEGFCEARTVRCTGRAQHMHHRLPRSAGGRHTAGNLLDVCVPCHRWVHDHPAYSYTRGWLRRRGPITKGLVT